MDPIKSEKHSGIIKEFDCFITPEFSKKLLLLLHKNRDKSRPLETENLRSARIKATLDHLELNIGDGRLGNVTASAEKKDSLTLRSTPCTIEPSLLGYFINGECHFVPMNTNALVMGNVKEPVKVASLMEVSPDAVQQQVASSGAAGPSKPTVVSARMRTEAENFGAKRAASRRKTAENDADLMYLSQLQLTPWRPVRFRKHKSMFAFDHRSILMCRREQATNDYNTEFTKVVCEDLLLSKLREEANEVKKFGEEISKQPSLEDLVRSVLLKAHVIMFDKLLEYLRERIHDKHLVSANAVIPILNRVATLLCGWWVIKSDILYPPNTFSEHASVPSPQLVRARDYVMAVFHRGDHLTRKAVSSITKLPSLEVTEILERLGTRISSGYKGHSNHWEFHPPDLNFIRRYPEVAHQHSTGWDLRIRQLCIQLKLERLVTDGIQGRRRCCSGRLSSGSENEGSGSSRLLSPPFSSASSRPTKRSRILSLSPDFVGPNVGGIGVGCSRRPSKRARTRSVGAAGDTIPMVESSGESSLRSPAPPPSPPFITSTVSVQAKPTAAEAAPVAASVNPQPTPPPLRSKSPAGKPPAKPQQTATTVPSAASAKPSISRRGRLQLSQPIPPPAPPPPASKPVPPRPIMANPTPVAPIRTVTDTNPVKREPVSPDRLSTESSESSQLQPPPPSQPSPLSQTTTSQPISTASPPRRVTPMVFTVATPPGKGGGDLLLQQQLQKKLEEPSPPDPKVPEYTPAPYRVEEDPVIRNFVQEKLQSHPILAITELTKACQPFMASLGNGGACSAVPPGSEAEREVLKLQLYGVLLSVGGRELRIDWPRVPTALPRQALFVAPVAQEFGDPSSTLHRVRDIILESFEASSFVTFGGIRKKLIEADIKIPDNTLRTTIKRYCVYRFSKYFLRYTVSE